MTTISEKPISNILVRVPRRVRRSGRTRRPRGEPRAQPFALRRFLLLRLAFDRRAADLRRRRPRLLRGACRLLARLHSFLEALDRATEVLPDIAELLRAEDQH